MKVPTGYRLSMSVSWVGDNVNDDTQPAVKHDLIELELLNYFGNSVWQPLLIS